MIATIKLIFTIIQILWEIEPELVKAWTAIMAAIPATSPPGNAATVDAVKTTAKAILPVLDEATAGKVNQAIADYDATVAIT